MANASGIVASPPAPSAGIANAVCNFLTTGSLAPTLATPTFRAGSTNTYTTSSAPSTVSIPLSSSIQVGDLIVCAVQSTTTAYPPSPNGFNVLAAQPSSINCWVFWKIAQAGDPGSSVSWVHGLGAVGFAIATCSYSGVHNAVPGYWNYNYSNPVTTVNAPAITTPVASTVLSIFGILSPTSGVTVTGPTTQRITANIGTTAVVISDQTQGAAGSTGTQTGTASAAGNFNGWTIVLYGAASGGTVPPGGWSMVDVYSSCTNPSNANPINYVVFQSPGASNNLGATWYLILYYQPWTTTTQTFGFSVCETYTAASHTFNAAVIQAQSSPPPVTTISSSTTPPYAQVFGSSNVISQFYSSQMAPNFTSLSTTTNNVLVCANRDGFFLSVLAGGSLSNAAYAGGGTTLINNPSLTSYELPLMMASFASTNNAGLTREPGWTGTSGYWGTYQMMAFVPANQLTLQNILGIVPSTNGDLFLGASVPIAARWFLSRNSSASNPQTIGNIRALLPAWIQYANQTSCAWGDTVTEGSDTLTFAGQGPGGSQAALWIDTVAA